MNPRGAIHAPEPFAEGIQKGLFFRSQKITTKEIAELCKVDERTIRRWVEIASDKMSGLSDKMSEAFKSKVLSDFTLTETIAIIRAGGNDTLADLLSQNAKGETKKELNASFIREARKLFETNLLSRDEARAMIGIKTEAKMQTSNTVELISGPISKGSKQVLAVARKMQEKIESQHEIEKKNGKLF